MNLYYNSANLDYCCVPDCKAGYENTTSNEIIAFFKPPEKSLSIWNEAIPGDFVLTANDRVCSRHFLENDIIKQSNFIVKGKLVELPTSQWTLRYGATPKVFSDFSNTRTVPSIRNATLCRKWLLSTKLNLDQEKVNGINTIHDNFEGNNNFDFETEPKVECYEIIECYEGNNALPAECMIEPIKKIDPKSKYACNICEKRFSQEFQLIKHTKSHKIEENGTTTEEIKFRKYSCDICKMIMKTEINLIKHMKLHKNEEHSFSYVCDICDEHFTRYDLILKHKEITIGNLQCDICKNRFRNKCILITHMESHAKLFKSCKNQYFGENQKKNTIPEFTEVFVKDEHLDVEEVLQNNRSKSKKNCQSNFDDTITGILGKENNKQQPVIIRVNRKSSKKKNLTNCSKKFTGKENNRQQFNTIKDPNGVIKFQCNLCKRIFRRQISIVGHMKKCHHSSSVKIGFKCHLCRAIFKATKNLSAHMRYLHSEREFLCPICQRGFKRNWHLSEHLKRHYGQKPYQCDICKKMFFTKAELQPHMHKHLGKKLFSCNMCDKQYTKIDTLNTHKRIIHLGVRSFKCKFCKKLFKYKNVLQRHQLRLHS